MTGIFATCLGICFAKEIFENTKTSSPSDETSAETTDENITETATQIKPQFINLQPTIDTWAAEQNFAISLMIYDLDNNEIAAAINPDEILNVASIYKLFFVYPTYRDIDQGDIDSELHFVDTFDYRAGSYTIGECLDLMIRESYNGCADPMRSNPTYYSSADNFISELGLSNTQSAGLYSTATDLTELLKYIYAHSDLSEESWAKLANSMQDQPATNVGQDTLYNWRQGLPAGFSEETEVLDKVGWSWSGTNWEIYDDAAIITFPELARHYTVVILTSGITTHTPTPIIELGNLIESTIRENSKG